MFLPLEEHLAECAFCRSAVDDLNWSEQPFFHVPVREIGLCDVGLRVWIACLRWIESRVEEARAWWRDFNARSYAMGNSGEFPRFYRPISRGERLRWLDNLVRYGPRIDFRYDGEDELTEAIRARYHELGGVRCDHDWSSFPPPDTFGHMLEEDEFADLDRWDRWDARSYDPREDD